jgi:organic anion transporter 4A
VFVKIVHFSTIDDPGIEPTDPRYVGAWWIGFLITGTTLTIATLPMFLFPKELKKTIENMDNSKQTTQKSK